DRGETVPPQAKVLACAHARRGKRYERVDRDADQVTRPRMPRRVVPAGGSVHECETFGTAFPFESSHSLGRHVEQGRSFQRGQGARRDDRVPVPEHHEQQRGREDDQAERPAHGHAVRLRRRATTAAAIPSSVAGRTQAAQKIARASRAVSASVEKGPAFVGRRRGAVRARSPRAATSTATSSRSRLPSTPSWKVEMKLESPMATSRPSRSPAGTRTTAPTGSGPTPSLPAP